MIFFDYDAHQTNLEKSVNEDIIRQMLESFDNDSEIMNLGNVVMELIVL